MFKNIIFATIFWNCATALTGMRSCLDLQHQSGYAQDGEYCLDLGSSEETLVRVYCHNMSSANPEEFITLPAGIFLQPRNYKIIHFKFYMLQPQMSN